MLNQIKRNGKTNLNSYHTLNETTMKKQILILFLAVFALGATQAYAQAELPYLPPTPIDVNCIDLDNPLTPVPGRPYTYQVDVPTPEGTKTYHWFVTQDTQFIVDGDLYINSDGTVEPEGDNILASGSAWYDDPGHTESTNEITLTWQSFTLNPGQFVFVVIYVTNNDGDGCETDNLKVYRIQPLHAFTLTLGNVYFNDDAGVDDFEASITFTPEICVDDVQSAVFDPDYDDGNGGVVYDYGQNEFYFAVAAANFSGPFQLAATFEGLQAATPGGTTDQSATIYWGTVLSDVITAETGGLSIDDGAPVLMQFETQTGSYGEADVATADDAAFMVYFKVVVDHNQFEATASVEYTLVLDGVLADGEDATGDPTYGAHDDANGLGDLRQDDCSRDAFHNRIAQLLLPRPTVESVPDGLLLPNAP